ncbi:DUF979 domain-containing protein [Clostridiaceae bacterium M8S5]|nr:DUF979 domain-containing protein [Clostridiaceae bacterium M8S5]
MKKILLETIYVLTGMVAILTAIYAFKDDKHPSRIGTGLFWGLVGIIFIFGKLIPGYITGGMIVFMGCLTAMKKVTFGSMSNASEKDRENCAIKHKNKLFIPALTIGIVAFIFGQFIKSLGGIIGLGVGALLALLIAATMTRTKPSKVCYDGSRLLQRVGAASILPQLLTALGALFTAAGVGDVISGGISNVIGSPSKLVGVIAYCLGMALFTMIMGNAFAAFSVMTVGIGMPFVIAQGANPAIACILALTAGYCGTLITPMAANFNIVPGAVLETKNKYRVIIAQLPYALVLWVIHVILMYTLAF